MKEQDLQAAIKHLKTESRGHALSIFIWLLLGIITSIAVVSVIGPLGLLYSAGLFCQGILTEKASENYISSKKTAELAEELTGKLEEGGDEQ
jgi:hypothetical protein